MDEFQKAHEFTALWEGGYVFHKLDPGGETNLGVTRRVWEAWCRECGVSAKPMRALTMQDVLPLYQARYWPHAHTLPWPLSGVAYDIAVNHGPGNLQYMLRAAGEHGTAHERAARLVDARERFFRSIVANRPDQGVFLRGWLRRVAAQREWLARQTAQPPRVLLVPKGGGDPVPWDGRPTRYGGQLLDEALASQLRLVYSSPGGPWEYAGLKVYVRRNGDLVLERMP